MHQRLWMDLADADAVLASAFAAAEQAAARVSIAVVDGAGQLVCFRRRDGASPASVETAMAKARTAALTGADSAAAEQAIAGGRVALLSLQGVLHQPCALMAGGLVLRCDQALVGAIGVSGMTPDVDAAVARAGVEAFALRARDCSS